MDKDELRKHKEEIIGLLKSTGLEEMDDFIAELENTGYFTAPASMNGHMCYEGGLMIHSLNVYYAARELKATFGKMRPDVFERISDASIIIDHSASRHVLSPISIIRSAMPPTNSVRASMAVTRARSPWATARSRL